MKTHNNRHIANGFSFEYTIFHQEDTDHNLDYADSNGDRYTQVLAEMDFSSTGLSGLRTSSLHFFPKGQGFADDSDLFVGEVTCDVPTAGTRAVANPATLLRRLELYMNVALAFDVHLEGDSLVVRQSGGQESVSMHLDVEPRDGEQQLRLAVIVPSSQDDSLDNRYDDSIFASELWVLLHDFAANLPLDIDANAHQYERVMFDETNPNQTLHIGFDRVSDAGRFGMALLQLLELHNRAYPTLAKDIDYPSFEHACSALNDSELREVIHRAITIAVETNSELGNDIIESSLAFQHELYALSEDLKATHGL